MTIDSDKQSFAPGREVILYELDCTGLGGELWYYCNSADEASPVSWGGNVYTPVPIDADGFEINGRGSLPTPKVRVSNVFGLASTLTQGFNDILGAVITRYRTFEQYLDSGATPDPTQHFPPDIFKVERKSSQNAIFVEWELSAAMDHEGRMLPGRQMLRDSCDQRYRKWNGSAFDYSKATCPYVGSVYYGSDGALQTSAALDKCGKRLSDCRKRYGTNPLPYRGFPSLSRIRM